MGEGCVGDAWLAGWRAGRQMGERAESGRQHAAGGVRARACRVCACLARVCRERGEGSPPFG